MDKIILILVDGMRPDAVESCKHPFVAELRDKSRYTLNAKTVMPSVTLPCHFSLFHSVEPERHGITTNVFTPQVRPVNGLFEVFRAAGKKCAMFYSWGELKDLARPDSLAYSEFISGHVYGYEKANSALTDDAVSFISKDAPDFVFLYLGNTDAVGHSSGWMSEAYIDAVYGSFNCIERVFKALPDGYTVIVTADHGGHGRTHGFDIPEDMTIPLFIYRNGIKAGTLEEVSIMDIAPTAATAAGITADSEWEGSNIEL